ncbi:MAG: amino acid ABC transporter permease [Spirochaetaceae bacterium]|nr:MAG: amino acid ABC transporter permease [Spirochaetaceae bacterium]
MIKKKTKFRPLDAVIILLCIGFVVYVYYRVKFGLEYKGDWSVIPRFLFRRSSETGKLVTNYLMQGLFATIKLSIWATLLALLAGFVTGLFRTSQNLFLQMVGRAYVELIRNLPPLVLIFIFYFFVVDQIMPLLGLEEFIRTRSDTSKAILAILFAEESLFVQFISGVFTIAFFEGAYITEIIRAGIESIERGQSEAAYSLGLSWFDKMRFIILPQAVKRVLPPLANEFINTIKYSAIASVVSIQELTFMGRQVVAATQYIFETWITVAVMYLVLTLTLSVLVSWVEKKMGQSD